jgi:hypothetical protein
MCSTSRSALRPSLSRQNALLDFGSLASRHRPFGCWCQKHPWTKMILRRPGNVRSGLPGRSLRCTRNRYPSACAAFRTVSSGLVLIARIRAIRALRCSGESVSAITRGPFVTRLVKYAASTAPMSCCLSLSIAGFSLGLAAKQTAVLLQMCNQQALHIRRKRTAIILCQGFESFPDSTVNVCYYLGILGHFWPSPAQTDPYHQLTQPESDRYSLSLKCSRCPQAFASITAVRFPRNGHGDMLAQSRRGRS